MWHKHATQQDTKWQERGKNCLKEMKILKFNVANGYKRNTKLSKRERETNSIDV